MNYTQLVDFYTKTFEGWMEFSETINSEAGITNSDNTLIAAKHTVGYFLF